MSSADHQVFFIEYTQPPAEADDCRRFCADAYSEGSVDLSVDASPQVIRRIGADMVPLFSGEIRDVLDQMKDRAGPSAVMLRNMFDVTTVPETPTNVTERQEWPDHAKLTAAAIMGYLGLDIRRPSPDEEGVLSSELAVNHIIPTDSKAENQRSSQSSTVNLQRHMDGAVRKVPPTMVALSSLRTGEASGPPPHNSFVSVQRILDQESDATKLQLRLEQYTLPYTADWYQREGNFPVLTREGEHLLFGNIKPVTASAKEAYDSLIHQVSIAPALPVTPDPGSITLFINYGEGAVLHDRSKFDSHVEPLKRRWTERIFGTTSEA